MKKQNNLIAVLLLATSAAWAQNGIAAPSDPTGEDRMVTPTPVSIQAYPMSFASEEPRSNYLRGGVTFGSAYDDNVLMTSPAVQDENYTVGPTISLQQTRSRLAWDLAYSPGFTFYQHTTSRNQVDQNLALSGEYRLSPHVTLTLADTFIRTSNAWGQTYQNPGGGAFSLAPYSVVAPIADLWSNGASAQITYQFAPNGMLGASGSSSELRYLNRSQVAGLYDSSARTAKGFYTHRLSGQHYIGASYSFQRLLASPGDAETQTNSVVFFYTLYLNPMASLSVFAGPEHSDTSGGTIAALKMWSPAAGASFGWHGARNSFTASVARRITEGGGLPGAVRSETADASFGRRLTAKLTAELAANYADNTLLDSLSSSSNGHTLSGGASLQRSLREHLDLQIGYTRLHQSYAGIPAVSAAPDRNRVWVSVSYQFERPLGR